MPEQDEPLVDELRRIGPNDIRITKTAARHWLVSRLPIDVNDPAWPRLNVQLT